MRENDVTLGFRLTRSLKRRLRSFARANDLTPAQVLRRLLREHLDRHGVPEPSVEPERDG